MAKAGESGEGIKQNIFSYNYISTTLFNLYELLLFSIISNIEPLIKNSHLLWPF